MTPEEAKRIGRELGGGITGDQLRAMTVDEVVQLLDSRGFDPVRLEAIFAVAPAAKPTVGQDATGVQVQRASAPGPIADPWQWLTSAVSLSFRR